MSAAVVVLPEVERDTVSPCQLHFLSLENN